MFFSSQAMTKWSTVRWSIARPLPNWWFPAVCRRVLRNELRVGLHVADLAVTR